MMGWSDKGYSALKQPCKTVQLHIVCGDVTCASAQGSFCAFMGMHLPEGVRICRLFPAPGSCHTVLEERDGWAIRCDACRAATGQHNFEEHPKATGFGDLDELLEEERDLG